MAWLVAATAFLVASHVLPSAPGVREQLIARLGKSGFYGAYSALSLLALGLVVWFYRAAGPQDWLYPPLPGAPLVGLAAMLPAVLLLVARLLTPAGPEPRGVYRITAVPGSLAVLVWALVHLLNRGEARLAVIFAGMAVLALAALIKNLRTSPLPYRRIGWLPFAAIARGREPLILAEIGWWRIALGLGGYAALVLLHPLVIGADPIATVRYAQRGMAE